MPEITITEIKELADPKLRAIAMRVFNTARLAAEKAVAHHTDPVKYPMSADAKGLEQIFLSRFGKLRQEKQQAAVARTMSFVNAKKSARIAAYGDLAKVNLKAPTAIISQAKALKLPPSLKFKRSHLTSMPFWGGLVPAVQLPPSPFRPRDYVVVVPPPIVNVKGLDLQIHRVSCIDETGGGFGGEWGEDEISLGGSTVDESGDVEQVAQFEVRDDFDDGEVKNYAPPKKFASFVLSEGTDWPKSYFVTFVLAEVDMGGFADFLNSLLDRIKDQVIASLTAVVGSLIGASGGPIGAAIGAAVGFVVGKIFEWLRAWWSDDIFAPVTVSVELASLNARWGGSTTSPMYTATFSGHDGRYELNYDWRLTW